MARGSWKAFAGWSGMSAVSMGVKLSDRSRLKTQGSRWVPSARNGSMTIEYAASVAIVAAAIAGMTVYFYRALCGHFRQTGDEIGHGRQYEPGRTVDL